MICIRNRLDKGPRIASRIRAVAALFRPRLYDIPIVPKPQVALGLIHASIVQIRNSDKIAKVVLVTSLDLLPIGKLVPPGSLCDAGLQRTFDSVPSQVVGPVMQASFASAFASRIQMRESLCRSRLSTLAC
jgi:hypothetical protein